MSILSWFTIGDGCPFRATATGSDEAYLIFGQPPHQHELAITREALRVLVTKSAAVLAEIDGMAEQEAASRRDNTGGHDDDVHEHRPGRAGRP